MATNTTNNTLNNNINANNNKSNNNNKDSAPSSSLATATATVAEPIIPSSSANPTSVSFALSTKKSKQTKVSKNHNNKPPIAFQARHDDYEDDDESSSRTIATLALLQSQERQKLGIQLVIPLLDGGDDDDREKNRNQPLLAGRLQDKGRVGEGSIPMESKSTDPKDNNNNKKNDLDEMGGDNHPVHALEHHKQETTDKDLDQEAADALLQDARDAHASSTSTNGNTNFSSRGHLIIPANNDSRPSKDQHRDEEEDDDDEAAKYKRDLQHRAQDLDVTSNAYISIPISEFGAAMLRGMGWKGTDAAAAGGDDDENYKNANVKDANKKAPSGVLPRPHRLGLGATPLPPSMKHSKRNGGDGIGGKRYWKGGKGGSMSDIAHVQREKEEEERWKQQMLERNKRELQLTLQVGSIVRVRKEEENGVDDVVGRDVLCHEERAKVIQTAGVPGLNRIMIQYEGDEKRVAVKKSSVELVDRSELEKKPFEEVILAQSHKPEQTIQTQRDEQHSKRNHHHKDETDNQHRHRHHHHWHHEEHDRSNKDDHRSSSKRRHEETLTSTNSSSSSRKDNHSHRDSHKRPHHEITTKEEDHWLIPNIRVRVITKKIAKGRQFREKGIVLDVLKHGMEATIQMSNGDILERVPERYLETALPKAGGNVIVLVGSNKYEKGKLLERHSDKGRGVVQLFEDMNVVTLSLDDIAEYCAPLDDTLGDY